MDPALSAEVQRVINSTENPFYRTFLRKHLYLSLISEELYNKDLFRWFQHTIE